MLRHSCRPSLLYHRARHRSLPSQHLLARYPTYVINLTFARQLELIITHHIDDFGIFAVIVPSVTILITLTLYVLNLLLKWRVLIRVCPYIDLDGLDRGLRRCSCSYAVSCG